MNKQQIIDWSKWLRFYFKPYLIPHSKKNLPGFLIIGAQKSGTSSLFYNMNMHPDVYMAAAPNFSEVKFFSLEIRWQKGINWYMGHFTQSNCLQGEKDPECLFYKKCHSRMHQVIPHAKLIILLRNPVDRAYSQWNHYNQIYETYSRNWGWQYTDFETAITKSKEVIKRGEYIDQITSLLNFFPREQVYIGIAEKLRRHPHKELAKIFSFVEVSPSPCKFQNRLIGKYPCPMKEETRKLLQNHFKPINERLFNFLGYSVPEWES